MIHLVTQHGTGDTYMTLGFAKAYERLRGQIVQVQIPPTQQAIAAMFPDVSIGPAGVMNMGDEIVHVHPSARAGLDISRFALLDRPTTHADLWRAMLDLPLEEPMGRGVWPLQRPEAFQTVAQKVVVITNARSWPNLHPEFWDALIQTLSPNWNVILNEPGWSLEKLLDECHSAEWVIGPQCGVMAILCHALFPCRKTIATPAVEGTNWIVPRTYPYAYVTKFAGEDYGDVEEYRFGGPGSSPQGVVDMITRGPHFNRVKVSNRQANEVTTSMSYGDFCDRLSVLQIKVTKLPKEKAATVVREYVRQSYMMDRLLEDYPQLSALYSQLWRVNMRAWEFNEKAVPDALAHREMQASHAEAIRMNRERVRLKNLINEICGSPSQEIKSYYEGGKA